MGANVAQHLSPGSSNDDQGEMETNLPVHNKFSVSKTLDKTFKVKKSHSKSLFLNKDSDGPLSVTVQMIPLADIQDKQNGKEEKKKARTNRKQSRIGLNKIELRDCDIRISKINMTHHLQKKKVKVDVKRVKLPRGFCYNNNKVILSDVGLTRLKPTPTTPKECKNSDVGLNHLKPNPKTLKERKNNDKILHDFNQDHADDMFESAKPSNYISKLNLLDSSFSSGFSDEDESLDNHNTTPISKHVFNFGGWSQGTPDHLRIADETPDHLRIAEEEEGVKSKKNSSDLAFVHRMLDKRKKQQNAARKRKCMPQGIIKLVNGDKNDNAGCSTPKLRKPFVLQNVLSELQPVFENLNKSEQNNLIDEEAIEPYFDDDF